MTSPERDLYLSFCALSENGFYQLKQKSAANLGGFDHSFASRIVKKLIRNNFLKKTKDGFLCLIGFEKNGLGEQKSLLTDNFNGLGGKNTNGLGDNFCGLGEQKNGLGDNSTHTLLNTEESVGDEQFQSSTRNARQSEQNNNLRNEELGESEAVKILETMFNFQTGLNFATILESTVTDTDHWKKFLLTKISYADDPEQKRIAMQKWILKAYAEHCEKHPVPEQITEIDISKATYALPVMNIPDDGRSFIEIYNELKAQREGLPLV